MNLKQIKESIIAEPGNSMREKMMVKRRANCFRYDRYILFDIFVGRK